MIANVEGAEIQDESVRPIRILIADDDPAVLRVLNNVVRFLGHVVVGTAVSGKECIRRTQELRPDLLMLDLSMPDANGMEIAAVISKRTDVPIVIITGETDDETVACLRAAKVSGYLAKPFTLEGLKAAIETAIQQTVSK